MTDTIKDFRALIHRWPTKADFGREIAGDAAHGKIFYRRNRVPRRHWEQLMLGAHKMGLGNVDQEFLERLYEAGRGEGR